MTATDTLTGICSEVTPGLTVPTRDWRSESAGLVSVASSFVDWGVLRYPGIIGSNNGTQPHSKPSAVKDMATDSPSSTSGGRSTGVRPGLCCQKCHTEETEQLRLRGCSRCKFAYYCSVDCQKSHWRQHKPMCNARVETDAYAKDKLGATFVNAYARWVKDSRVGLTQLVHRLLKNSQVHNHVVHVAVDYHPEETPQFKIVYYKPLTLKELRQIDKDEALYIEENMRNGQAMFAESSGGTQCLGFAVIYCRNVDAPVRATGLGIPFNTPIVSTAPEIVMAINEGAYKDM